LNIGRGTTVNERFGRATVGAASLLVAMDGVWLGLNYLNQTTTGFITAVVLATFVGAVVAAWQPGVQGWLGLIIGGGAGAIGISIVGLPFVLNNAWGILALFGLAVSNLLLIGIFGSLGFGYWTASGLALRSAASPRVASSARALVLVLVGSGVILGSRIAIPEQPDGVYVRNNTTIAMRFFAIQGGSLRGVSSNSDVYFLPGVQSVLIFPTNGLLGPDGCTSTDIIARDPAGTEVARHAPGLCEGDLWVVGSPATTR
jgi:hypothetical protein